MATLSSGLLLFSWTANDRVSVIAQLLAEIPIGAGMYMVWVTYVKQIPCCSSLRHADFLSGTVYLQDLYVVHANSALAACAFVRYTVGSVFPLFASSMYDKLGMAWVSHLGHCQACLI